MGASQITSLPLSKEDRAEFIETANRVFESVIERMRPRSPDEARKLWDAGDYVDNLLQPDMLPIDREYALSLIDAFLVGHVVSLAGEADDNMGLARQGADVFCDDLDSGFDFEGQPGLKCDVEMNIESGDTDQEVLATAAEALRSLAAAIEAGKLGTGFHPIKTPSGEKIGEFYLDYCETFQAGAPAARKAH